MFIYSYNENSAGAAELGKAIPAKRIKHEGSRFIGGPGKIVINWGSSTVPDEVSKHCRVLNPPDAINRASNKLHFFQDMTTAEQAPRIPNFTNDPNTAREWVRDGTLVVARRILQGHSGEGIQFISRDEPNSFVEAPLYTKYVKKKSEYRVHFMNGNVIDIQRKALRPDYNPETVNWKVRNLANGFIFARNDIEVPADVTRQSELTIAATNLDFGAIDLIYNENEQHAYVLEVNTAPGLAGTTITNYANGFRSYLS